MVRKVPTIFRLSEVLMVFIPLAFDALYKGAKCLAILTFSMASIRNCTFTLGLCHDSVFITHINIIIELHCQENRTEIACPLFGMSEEHFVVECKYKHNWLVSLLSLWSAVPLAGPGKIIASRISSASCSQSSMESPKGFSGSSSHRFLAIALCNLKVVLAMSILDCESHAVLELIIELQIYHNALCIAYLKEIFAQPSINRGTRAIELFVLDPLVFS